MKTCFSLLALLFFAVFATAQIQTGMSLEAFEEVKPGLKKTFSAEQINFSEPAEWHGLEGEWGYRFKEGKLDWFFFQRYENELNEANFTQFLQAAEAIIAEYTEKYGAPTSLEEGDKFFKDPAEERHWGYEVIEATWQDAKGDKVKAGFKFFGSKGTYFFLLKVNHFAADYPYFD